MSQEKFESNVPNSVVAAYFFEEMQAGVLHAIMVTDLPKDTLVQYIIEAVRAEVGFNGEVLTVGPCIVAEYYEDLEAIQFEIDRLIKDERG